MTGTPQVLVTGGTGPLGRRVVERLRATGCDVRVLSRSGKGGTVRGNLLTREKVWSGPWRVLGPWSTALLAPGRRDRWTSRGRRGSCGWRGGVSDVVFVSIVGVDRNPYFPYYRMKLETERIVERSPVP